jgi:hypothetical protein
VNVSATPVKSIARMVGLKPTLMGRFQNYLLKISLPRAHLTHFVDEESPLLVHRALNQRRLKSISDHMSLRGPQNLFLRLRMLSHHLGSLLPLSLFLQSKIPSRRLGNAFPLSLPLRLEMPSHRLGSPLLLSRFLHLKMLNHRLGNLLPLSLAKPLSSERGSLNHQLRPSHKPRRRPR